MHRTAEAGETAVGTGYNLTAQHHFAAVIGAAARVLASETAAGSKRADQRHFPVLLLFQPDNARQRLTGDAVGVDAKEFGKLGRKRDDAQFLVSRPFVPGS